MNKIKVHVWNEYYHEQNHQHVRNIYPDGIHGAIAAALGKDDAFEITTSTLYDEEQGLSEETVGNTDVMLWWGHLRHGDVGHEAVNRVVRRVHAGMGLIVLHSGHMSRPFTRLMGTGCGLRWHEMDEKEYVWTVNAGHRITKDVPPVFEIPKEEMYGEVFDIPQPDELVFISWFKTGEVFRSGCCFKRGKGRIFYFQPGHESYPIYYQPEIGQVLRNAAHWAAPDVGIYSLYCPQGHQFAQHPLEQP